MNFVWQAMAEDVAAASATSKGSSPDMDEYEVIQTTRPTDAAETADSSAPSVGETSTINDS